MRFDDKIIQKLLELNWWDFDINDLSGVNFAAIDIAIEQILELEAKGKALRKQLNYNKVFLHQKGYSNLKLIS